MAESMDPDLKEINNEEVEEIRIINTEITPPQKVERSGIAKLIAFFKKPEDENPDIQQIETPTEEDSNISEYDSDDEDHDDDDDKHDDNDDDDDDD